MLRERVQVSAEVLHSLLVGFGCFLQDPLHLSLLLHLLKGHLGWGPLTEVAPQLLLLVLLDFSHRFQEFCLVYVLFLLRPLTKVVKTFRYLCFEAFQVSR